MCRTILAILYKETVCIRSPEYFVFMKRIAGIGHNRIASAAIATESVRVCTVPSTRDLSVPV
jgi:hypothetical protein